MVRSVMTHNFATAPTVAMQRSSFRRDCGYKTTFDAGFLIPIYYDECLPGDTHTVRMNGFGRMATPIHPVMDNMFLSTFFFFVPNRLLWDNWEKFNGAQDNPGDSTDYQVPYMTAPLVTGYDELSIADYLGLPTKVPGYVHNALYHRAYNKIFADWFRDENLQNSPVLNTDDGPDDPSDYPLLRRGKRHDYFTSCLPWPQKDNGNEVLLPLGNRAPLSTDTTEGGNLYIYSTVAEDRARMGADTTTVTLGPSGGGSASQDLYADLSQATASTINDLRQAFQVQRMFEKDARGGTRYVEVIKNHFQVVSPDFRLQRPEYLGGGRTPVNIHPVTQTSESGTQPQGSMAAFGTVGVSGHGFTKSFTEHGVILGLASVNADLTYQQGLDRHFSRQTRFDYFWPALANLGEQAVLNQEIFTQGSNNGAQDAAVFGYQERWAEYRYKPSRITGLFRSNAASSLDPWHLSQDFAALPVLNAQFIEDNPPMDRVLYAPEEPDFILDVFFNVRSARPMPVNSVPGLIDHF